MQQRASLLKRSTPTAVPGGQTPTAVPGGFAQTLALKEHMVKAVRGRLVVGVYFTTLSSLSSAYANTMLCPHVAKLPPTNCRGICQECGNV